jgi:16S rRNA (guanine527-N7)-methyltransferase
VEAKAPVIKTEDLVAGAGVLGVLLTQQEATRLVVLLTELLRWNRSYNLTAITDPAAMITHHVLDSLAVQAYLDDAAGGQAQTVADVGTGAGFPGLPLALVNPGLRFTLIDASGKKVRFVAHAAHAMGLANITALHARVEEMKPLAPFDVVIARAFAALPVLLSQVQRLCGPATRVLAMKGRRPEEELAAVPAHWRVDACHELLVPGLEAERSLVILRPAS